MQFDIDINIKGLIIDFTKLRLKAIIDNDIPLNKDARKNGISLLKIFNLALRLIMNMLEMLINIFDKHKNKTK